MRLCDAKHQSRPTSKTHAVRHRNRLSAALPSCTTCYHRHTSRHLPPDTAKPPITNETTVTHPLSNPVCRPRAVERHQKHTHPPWRTWQAPTRPNPAAASSWSCSAKPPSAKYAPPHPSCSSSQAPSVLCKSPTNRAVVLARPPLRLVRVPPVQGADDRRGVSDQEALAAQPHNQV